MQNFIVLGLVPGTQIQLTFTFWVIVASILIGLPALYAAAKASVAAAQLFTHAFDEAEFIIP